MNTTLYKYQKATLKSQKRMYHQGSLLREWYHIYLGKQVVGFGPRNKCRALKDELNRSRSKRIFLGRHERSKST